MAITGTSYLFGYKGQVEKTLVQEGIFLPATSEKNEVIKDLLSDIDQDYSYETLKDRGSAIQTRPTTRQYYEFKKTSSETFSLYKAKPNLLSRIIEVHKGHGPALLKYLEKALGISLFFIVLTGLIMSLMMKPRFRPFLLTSASGAIILLLLFFL
jgi:hypothetical protein